MLYLCDAEGRRWQGPIHFHFQIKQFCLPAACCLLVAAALLSLSVCLPWSTGQTSEMLYFAWPQVDWIH